MLLCFSHYYVDMIENDDYLYAYIGTSYIVHFSTHRVIFSVVSLLLVDFLLCYIFL